MLHQRNIFTPAGQLSSKDLSAVDASGCPEGPLFHDAVFQAGEHPAGEALLRVIRTLIQGQFRQMDPPAVIGAGPTGFSQNGI